MDIFYYLVSFFLIINVVVFVHEYGHFLAAKKVGVKITKFSIGIGPEVCGLTDRHGTRWCFSLLPIGGFVMMLGDEDMSSATGDEEVLKKLTEEEKQQAFANKSNWEKMFVAFSGPLFNYIYAFLVIFLMCFFYGLPSSPPTVGDVLKGSPAEKVQLRPGDRIVLIDGQQMEKFQDIVRKIQEPKEGPLTFVIERDNAQKEILIVPEIRETKQLVGSSRKIKQIGIKPSGPVFTKKGLVDSFLQAGVQCVNASLDMCRFFSQLFSGRRHLDDFGGFVRIAEIAGDLSKTGSLALLIMFTVSLSLNLGLINLFPLPVLDGGTILISLIEQLSGKKLNKRLQEYIMTVCTILLVSLMLLTTVNDVLRLEPVRNVVFSIMGRTE